MQTGNVTRNCLTPLLLPAMQYTVRILTGMMKFSVPQKEYPLGWGNKKGSHVYFLLIVNMVHCTTIV